MEFARRDKLPKNIYSLNEEVNSQADISGVYPSNYTQNLYKQIEEWKNLKTTFSEKYSNAEDKLKYAMKNKIDVFSILDQDAVKISNELSDDSIYYNFIATAEKFLVKVNCEIDKRKHEKKIKEIHQLTFLAERDFLDKIVREDIKKLFI